MSPDGANLETVGSGVAVSPSAGQSLPRRGKQLLALILIVFLCGFLTGTLSRRLTSAIVGAPETEVHGANRYFIEEFSDRYDLDRNQRLRLRTVLDRRDLNQRRILDEIRRTRSGEERDRMLGDVLEENRKADRRIPEILNLQQRNRYLADLAKEE